MAGEMRVAHVAVELGKAELLGEEVAVDVGELLEFFVEPRLAFFHRRIEHGEQECQSCSKIAAVLGGAVLDVEAEGFTVEQAGVLGEQTEQDAHEELLEVVPGVTASFERIMQLTEHFGGFDVDGVLFLELVLLVTGDEREVVDVLVQLREREGDASVLLQIVQRNAREVRDDDVAGNLFAALLVAGEVLDVVHRLGVRLAKVLAKTLVFNQDDTTPEAINETILTAQIFDGFFKAHCRAAVETENGEEFVPESLLLGFLAGFSSPILGEADGIVANFIPTERHGGRLEKRKDTVNAVL